MQCERMTWRRATQADEPLLVRLFAEEKARDFAPLGLASEQLQPLIEMQFRARQTGYAQAYPAATDFILCLEDGGAVGRQLVERQADCYRCIDIAILEEHRDRGIGTWALRQMQQIAAVESVPFRLRVLKGNPALRLYERLGFIRASADEMSYEMEWQPPRAAKPAGNAAMPSAMETAQGVPFDRTDVIERIVVFLREIGLDVMFGPVPSSSFLPGIQPVRHGLRVDEDALQFPGDLLHEAGHLAVMTPAQRDQEFPHSTEPAEEIAALAWSYAAALHIGIAPEIVFHEHGYRGQAHALLQGYRNGGQTGVPLLAWFGMTTMAHEGAPSIYPRMLSWLRQELDEAAGTDTLAEVAGIGVQA